MISVIIATKNRPQAIHACVASILNNQSDNVEIIVVDQSSSDDTEKRITGLRNTRVMYKKDAPKGKSHALNIGYAHAKGTILAFTDDDCIVSTQWIQSILDSFANRPSISAVFGQTKPYFKTKIPGTRCPSVFSVQKEHIIDKPCYHAVDIGFGNNMAILKSALTNIGGFRTWLGPGSLGLNAEDADVALRILIDGGTLFSNPGMLVFHNKWLLPSQARKQELLYASGEMACYCYFVFRGFPFAYHIIKRINKKEFARLQKSIRAFIRFPWRRGAIGRFYWIGIVLFYRAWGTGVAWYFSKAHSLYTAPASTHTKG